jgi:hypothetical protein
VHLDPIHKIHPLFRPYSGSFWADGGARGNRGDARPDDRGAGAASSRSRCGGARAEQVIGPAKACARPAGRAALAPPRKARPPHTDGSGLGSKKELHVARAEKLAPKPHGRAHAKTKCGQGPGPLPGPATEVRSKRNFRFPVKKQKDFSRKLLQMPLLIVQALPPTPVVLPFEQSGQAWRTSSVL